jgi:transposase-like protein
MPYFQGTALTYMKKILLLFQGVVDNERESGFRWLLEQVRLLLRQYEAEDPTLFVTDYNNTLINTLESEFPQARHQLCVFHINMNIALHVKKKWRKPAGLMAAEEEEAEDAEEEEDPDVASLNALARNKVTIAGTVPEDIPYTWQALFDLLKFIEYSTDHKVYETAWQQLQEKFSDHTAILNADPPLYTWPPVPAVDFLPTQY